MLSRAGDWLLGQTAPSFVIASVEAPHPPYNAPVPEGTPRIAPEQIQLPANVPSATSDRARRELAGYYAHIAATDRAIGQLVDRLHTNLTILVTSAHGDMHGSHGLFRKGWPHEESVRVPFVVAGPNLPTGQVSDEPVSLLDLPAMTQAWAEGKTWSCARDRAPISMPSVVDLPDQCDRVWSGWRTPKHKEIRMESGEVWKVD